MGYKQVLLALAPCYSRLVEPYTIVAPILSWSGTGFSLPRKIWGPALGVEACDGFAAFHTTYFITCFSFA